MQQLAHKHISENKICCDFPRGKMDKNSSNPAVRKRAKLSPKSVASYARATCCEVVLQDGDKFVCITQERIFKIRNAKGTIMFLVVARQPESLDIVGIAPTSDPRKWRILGANRVFPLATCVAFEKALSNNPVSMPSWLAKLWRPNDPKLKCDSNYQLYSVDGKRIAKRSGILRVITYNMLAPCYFRLRTPSGETRLESDFPVLYVERLRKIAAALLRLKADVLLLQEVWVGNKQYMQDMKALLGHMYTIHTCKRPRQKQDGAAILVTKLPLANGCTPRVVKTTCMEYGMVGQRVAMIAHLQLEVEGRKSSLYLCNTHLTFPHHSFDIALRLRQACKLVSWLRELKERDPSGLFILGGDFNGQSDNVTKALQKANLVSSFAAVNGHEVRISHSSHREDQVGVDYLWTTQASESLTRLTPTYSALIPVAVADDTPMVRPVYQVPTEPSSTVRKMRMSPVTVPSTPLSMSDWCQLSDHRPLITEFDITPR